MCNSYIINESWAVISIIITIILLVQRDIQDRVVSLVASTCNFLSNRRWARRGIPDLPAKRKREIITLWHDAVALGSIWRRGACVTLGAAVSRFRAVSAERRGDDRRMLHSWAIDPVRLVSWAQSYMSRRVNRVGAATWRSNETQNKKHDREQPFLASFPPSFLRIKFTIGIIARSLKQIFFISCSPDICEKPTVTRYRYRFVTSPPVVGGSGGSAVSWTVSVYGGETQRTTKYIQSTRHKEEFIRSVRRQRGQTVSTWRRQPEHVKMDFKSVVYNAARDGKLKRLKVSALHHIRLTRNDCVAEARLVLVLDSCLVRDLSKLVQL